MLRLYGLVINIIMWETSEHASSSIITLIELPPRRKRTSSLLSMYYLCVMAFPFSLLEIFQSHNEFILFYHFDVSIKLLCYRCRSFVASRAHNRDVERVEITNIRNYLFPFSRHFPLLNLFYLICYSFFLPSG